MYISAIRQISRDNLLRIATIGCDANTTRLRYRELIARSEGSGARSLELELLRVYGVEAEGTTQGISILISLRLRRADKAS